MQFEYKLTKVAPLGDFDPKYGQRYWCNADGSDMPVSFNSLNRDITEGMTVSAEEKVIKLTKKNTEYVQLKKVKVVSNIVDDYAAPSPKQPLANPLDVGTIEAYLKRIESKLDKLLAMDIPDPEQALAQKQAEIDARAMSDKPVTIDDFGGEEI